MRKIYGPNHEENRDERENEFGQQDLVELSGATGTMILVQEDYFVVANCGDSPVVILREEIKGSGRNQ